VTRSESNNFLFNPQVAKHGLVATATGKMAAGRHVRWRLEGDGKVRTVILQPCPISVRLGKKGRMTGLQVGGSDLDAVNDILFIASLNRMALPRILGHTHADSAV
jgi:hypothetical protein